MLCSLLNIVKGYFIVSGLFGNYYVGPNNRTVAVSTVYETNRVTICNDLQYMKCFTGTDSSNKISVADNIYKFKNLKNNQIHYIIYDNHSLISQKHMRIGSKPTHVSNRNNRNNRNKGHVSKGHSNRNKGIKRHISKVKEVYRETLASRDKATRRISTPKISPISPIVSTPKTTRGVSTPTNIPISRSVLNQIETHEPFNLPLSNQEKKDEEKKDEDKKDEDDEDDEDEEDEDDHDHRKRRHIIRRQIIRRIRRIRRKMNDDDDDE